MRKLDWTLGKRVIGYLYVIGYYRGFMLSNKTPAYEASGAHTVDWI